MFGFGRKKPPASPPAPAAPPTARQGPFGEDIVNPDARAIPAPFHGRWGFVATDGAVRGEETVSADRLTIDGRTQKVVAVRFISPHQLAIVTQDPAGEYGLYYRGLQAGRLIDLESPDWTLTRLD